MDRIVLFVCVENACRSLMAEAMFNDEAPDGWVAASAGTAPARRANPRTQPMLRELGLALPAHPPTALSPALMDSASVSVTMGCLDDQSCPARLRQLHPQDWGLPDPAKMDDAGFRRVRDELRQRVRGLITELSSVPRPAGAGRGPDRTTAPRSSRSPRSSSRRSTR